MKRSGLKRRSVGQQHGSVGNGISCQAWQPVSPSELRAYKKRTNSSKLSSDLQKDDRACMPTYSTTSTNTNNIHMHKIKHTHWGRINKLTNNQMNIEQSQDGWCLRKDFWSAYSCVWGQAQTYTHTHTNIFRVWSTPAHSYFWPWFHSDHCSWSRDLRAWSHGVNVLRWLSHL